MNEFKPLSLQNLFDNAWKAFIIGDAKPAFDKVLNYYGDEDTVCRYLDGDGNKCAIGVSLPDGHPSQNYTKGFGILTEDYPELFDDYVKSLSMIQRNIFQQDLHDFLFDIDTLEFPPKEEMKKAYIKVAEKFGLTIPEGV